MVTVRWWLTVRRLELCFWITGLVDEITVTTVPILVGGDEKALKCGLSDGGTWIVRSNKMLVDGKMRTVYGKV